MTCIVGLVDNGKVYIGGDSAGCVESDLRTRADEKVFINRDFIFGFTSSFRMGQLIRHSFVPPHHHPSIPDDKYLVTTFVNALRDCLKHGGYVSTVNGKDEGGRFLVGYRGKLYQIDVDFQVAEPLCQFESVGSGAPVALGSLYSTKGDDPMSRIMMALEAAAEFTTTVRGPFNCHVLDV